MGASHMGPRLEVLEARETPAVVGGLDPSFGTGGVVVTPWGAGANGRAVAAQPDGKVVVAGSTGIGSDGFAVARYNPDGTLDPTFAGAGKVAVLFGGADRATGVAVLPDGRIVVVGYTDFGGTAGNPNNFAIARLNPNGSLDGSFGGTGKVTVDFGLDDRAAAVVAQPDGKLVVVGSTDIGSADFAVLRLRTDGTLDDTFGISGSGKISFTFGGKDFATAVALQPDGRIVVAGYTDAGGAAGNPNNFAVARLTVGGGLDGSFDVDGKVTIDFGLDDRASGVALQPDGRIVVAGTTDAGSADFALARLNPDGSPDVTFDGDGRATLSFGGSDFASGVALQPDGRIVVAGTTSATGGGDFAIARFTPAGGLDGSFGGTGQTTIDFGGADTGSAVALAPNGRIVVAGTPVGGGFAVARVIGTVALPRNLAVSGQTNGNATIYTADPLTGQYNPVPIANVAPFAGFSGVVRAATGDVNGDGVPDTILVTGPGTPVRFAVIDGRDDATVLVPPTDPFGSDSFTGGGFVAAGDIDGDGRAEWALSPDQGGGPNVVIYSLGADGQPVVRTAFLGIEDPAFRGGARVAIGDINGDGFADVIVGAGFQGGPRVAVFAGRTLLSAPGQPPKLVANDFFAFPADAATLRDGVFVAAGDIDGDGFADLVFGGGPGGGPRVVIFSGQLVAAGDVAAADAAPLANFFFGDPATRPGVRVAVKDADGDNKADLVAGSGQNLPTRVRIYLGRNFTDASEPAVFQDLDPFATTLPGGLYVG